MDYHVMIPSGYHSCSGLLHGKSFTVRPDIDGVRCIAGVYNNTPFVYSATECEGPADCDTFLYESLLKIYQNTGEEDFVFDCVLTMDGKRMTVYDMLDYDGFMDGTCRLPFSQRMQRIYACLPQDCDCIVRAPVLYNGSDVDYLIELSHSVNILVNLNDAVYEFGESDSMFFVL